MNLITIGGYVTPAPTAYSVSASDLDSSESGRSESGELSRECIRQGIRKINVTWRVTTAELSELTAAIFPAAFYVTFFYPTMGYYAENVRMYAGDRTLTLVADNTSEGGAYWDLSVNFIEY